MADQKQWFKLWCSALDDPDLGNLSNEDFGRWCKLGAYVKKHGNDGSIQIKTPGKVLQGLFQVITFADVLDVLNRFPNLTVENGDNCNGAVALQKITFSNWHKYQVDNSYERVQKHRNCNGTRGEEKRGEKKRREEKKKVVTPDGQNPTDQAHQLPADFKPEDNWLPQFLRTQGLVNFTQSELESLMNPAWWDRTAIACGGLDRGFLEREFAKMGNWLALARNKGKRPSRQRIGNWLMKAGDQ